MTPSQYRKKLKAFLDHNPWSKIEKISEPEELVAVTLPWQDESIALALPRLDSKALFRLNRLVLFPQFSAVFHRLKNSIEFIYTPYRGDELDTRDFVFEFEGQSLRCAFLAASREVLDLAEASEPLGPSTRTDYRNLRSFKRYISLEKEYGKEKKFRDAFSPTSFWIYGCGDDPEALARLAQHINFYMHYFDRESPLIQIHEALPSDAALPDRERYLWDTFPKTISGRAIDPYLLAQLSSANEVTDPYRRFLYYYQVLEYVGFYYVGERTNRRIESILKAPETPAFPKAGLQRIQDVLTDEKMQDAAKIAAAITDCCDPGVVWREIEPIREHLERETVFDGGFTVKPIICDTSDANSFTTSGFDKLGTTLRSIRNALVHAREQRMANVIGPSARNHRLLRPFLRPLSTIAQQLVFSVDPESER